MIPEITEEPYADFVLENPKKSFGAKISPTLSFYRKVSSIVFKASAQAKKGLFDDLAWYDACSKVLDTFASCGADIEIKNTKNFFQLDGPCVFIGNHMSTAETFILAKMILPKSPVTFVVKEALVEYPIFKHIMRSRNPVVVGRQNPRQDLKTVLEEGTARLKSGMSVVIFPQRTRAEAFDPVGFNSIGVKLAKKADVPIVPLALKTNAWRNGKWFKDFGPFDPSQPVRFNFGEPMRITEGTGKAENEAVVDFILKNLREWNHPIKES